tara:strand:+ start:364 stop:582 length:219 start_codon:yes stop_codon:yes gene_type:complete
MGAPRYKLYHATDGYVGSAKTLFFATKWIVTLPKGSSIRTGHRKQDTIFVTQGDEVGANVRGIAKALELQAD